MKIKNKTIYILTVCFASSALFFSGCSKEEEKTSELPTAEDVKVAVATNAPAPVQPKAEVKLDKDVLGVISGNVLETRIDTKDADSLAESIAAMQAELFKLPADERRALEKRYQESAVRMVTDLYKKNPDMALGPMKMQMSGAGMEEMVKYQEKIQFEMMKEFNGKNIYEIVESVEVRSAGRPPAMEELQTVMKEIMESKAEEIQAIQKAYMEKQVDK